MALHKFMHTDTIFPARMFKIQKVLHRYVFIWMPNKFPLVPVDIDLTVYDLINKQKKFIFRPVFINHTII